MWSRVTKQTLKLILRPTAIIVRRLAIRCAVEGIDLKDDAQGRQIQASRGCSMA